MNENGQPNFLLERDPSNDWLNWRNAGIGSVVFHIVLLTVAFTWKSAPYEPLMPERPFIVHVTPLYTPPDLTQKAPNKGPVSKTLRAPSIPVKQRLAAPKPAEIPPTPKPVPPPAQPPKQEIAKIEPPKIEPPSAAPVPVTPKPALPEPVVELPKAPTPQRQRPIIALPDTSIEANLRSRPPLPSSQSVGDTDSPGINLPPSPGQSRSSLELKSDPMGVDFKGYLLQVLTAVRRSWFAVYPESARLGSRGQVTLEFSIAKNGTVAKVVFTGQSGTRSLDQAAVAAISASNPLPALPAEFRGDRIILQMSFLYNMASR